MTKSRELEPMNVRIERVLAETDLRDPREIAAVVVGEVASLREARALLAEIAPVFVRQSFTLRRAGTVQVPPPAPVVGSWKVARAREAWARRLDTPVQVGKTTKPFGESTAEDLLVAAAALRGLTTKGVAKTDSTITRELSEGGAK